MQWEYWTLKVDAFVKRKLLSSEKISAEVLDRQLNEAGNTGWELVNAMSMNMDYGETAHILYTFKRPKA